MKLIVEIEGEVISVPALCCCCAAPVKGKYKYRATATKSTREESSGLGGLGQGGTTVTHEFSSFEFPICKKCKAWIDALNSATTWRIGFYISLALGLSCLGVGIVFLSRLWGICLLIGGLVLVGLAFLAMGVSSKRGKEAKERDRGRGCSSTPVTYSGWIGHKHRFVCANEEFYNELKRANGIVY